MVQIHPQVAAAPEYAFEARYPLRPLPRSASTHTSNRSYVYCAQQLHSVSSAHARGPFAASFLGIASVSTAGWKVRRWGEGKMEARNDSGHGRAHVHESHETLGDEEGPTQVAFVGPRAPRSGIRSGSSLTCRYYEGQHWRSCSRR